MLNPPGLVAIALGGEESTKVYISAVRVEFVLEIVCLILAASLLILAPLQLLAVVRYARILRTRPTAACWDETAPPVLLIMAVRGYDPGLLTSLEQLAASDYPCSRFRIVVDSAEDPAYLPVLEWARQRGDDRFEVLILPERRPFCSGKISAILHATEHLPDKCSFIFLADGDSLYFKNTISRMVATLQNPGVGVVTGNRWYYSRSMQPGTLVRMNWMSISLPSVEFIRTAWGGCLAFHAEVMSDPDFRDRLSRTFVEDAFICCYHLYERKQSVHYLAEATLHNHEDITLPAFYRFLLRQLLTLRMSHHYPHVILPYMWLMNLVMLSALAACFMPWIPYWGFIVAGYAILLSITTAGQLIGQGFNDALAIAQYGSRPQPTIAQQLLAPVAGLVVNILNLVALTHVWFVRRITWRSITYQFGPERLPTIIDVQPMAARSATMKNNSVL